MSLGGKVKEIVLAVAVGKEGVARKELAEELSAKFDDFQSGEKRTEGDRIPKVEGNAKVLASCRFGMYCVIGRGGGDIKFSRLCCVNVSRGIGAGITAPANKIECSGRSKDVLRKFNLIDDKGLVSGRL